MYVQVPALAYNVAYAIDASFVQASPRYIVLSHVRNLLVNVNSAVNFILYCAVGQKFRRVFLQTFCHWTRCGDVNRTPTGDTPMTGVEWRYNRRTTRHSPTPCDGAAVPMQTIQMHSGSECRTQKHQSL